MAEWWQEKGRKIYEELGNCVEMALEEENSEVAILCATPLAVLADLEGANYFGNEGYYNFNTAMDISKEAVKLAEEKGVPNWLKDGVETIKKILKDTGNE